MTFAQPLARRAALKLAGTTLAASVLAPSLLAQATTRRPKKVIVAGGGIGGLCCAYELMRRGHDVTVLEASDRVGGHILTGVEFADGLYADLGAEQCTDPGYELYRDYVKHFGLTLLPYRRRDHITRFINGKPYTEEMLLDRKILAGFELNQREVDFVAQRELADLKLLFFGPYLDAFTDEYQPFGVGFNDFDNLSVPDFLRREGASAAAARFIGRNTVSALHEMWSLAIMKQRRLVLHPRDLFRIKGGNQKLTDAFATALGPRVRRSSPITRIEHRDAAVKVHFSRPDGEKSIEADYLVNAIALPKFGAIPITPGWPEAKAWALQNVGYDMQTRVVFQCRSRFWKQDGVSPNIYINKPELGQSWECANEVPGERGILMGFAQPGTTPEQSVAVFRAHYGGKVGDIEKVHLKEWYRETWAPLCERTAFQVGQLAKFWPHLIRPHGRIHFVGAYADNLAHGMEAATRSAARVAAEIDAA